MVFDLEEAPFIVFEFEEDVFVAESELFPVFERKVELPLALDPDPELESDPAPELELELELLLLDLPSGSSANTAQVPSRSDKSRHVLAIDRLI